MKYQVTAAALAVAAIALASGCTPSHSATTGSAPAGSSSSSASSPTSAAGSSAPAATQAAAGSGGSSSGGVNVCSLMTSAQASAANNVTYGAATPQHVQQGYDTCTYANTGQHPDPVDIQQLTVSVISLAGCYDQLRQAEGPGTSVTGVGDAAFGYQIGIVVKQGGTCVEISGLTHAELNGDYSHDTAMAKIIIGALH
ncbi:MAG TPA: hypothetical protein VH478_11020 [Trebonia sp.]|jgi:hypothetical protein|nr:hypothetical protein [Trebonia sp.]